MVQYSRVYGKHKTTDSWATKEKEENMKLGEWFWVAMGRVGRRREYESDKNTLYALMKFSENS